MIGQLHHLGAKKITTTHETEGKIELRAGMKALDTRKHVVPKSGIENLSLGRPAPSIVRLLSYRLSSFGVHMHIYNYIHIYIYTYICIYIYIYEPG